MFGVPAEIRGNEFALQFTTRLSVKEHSRFFPIFTAKTVAGIFRLSELAKIVADIKLWLI